MGPQKTRSKLVISFAQVDGTHSVVQHVGASYVYILYIYSGEVWSCPMAIQLKYWVGDGDLKYVLCSRVCCMVPNATNNSHIFWWMVQPPKRIIYHIDHVALGVDLSRPSTLPNQIERIWQWSPPGFFKTGKITVLWSSMVSLPFWDGLSSRKQGFR